MQARAWLSLEAGGRASTEVTGRGAAGWGNGRRERLEQACGATESGARAATGEVSHEDAEVEVDVVRGAAASVCVGTWCRRLMKMARGGGDATVVRWFRWRAPGSRAAAN